MSYFVNGDIDVSRIKEGMEDVSRIKEGMEIKNYKEFCFLLGEPVKQGSSRSYQINNWKRFMDFEKIEGSQRYKVFTVFAEPFADHREHKGGRRGVYQPYIEHLIMEFITNSDNWSVRMSKRQFLIILGLISPRLKESISNAKVEATKQNDHYNNVICKIMDIVQTEQCSDFLKISVKRSNVTYENILKQMLLKDEPNKGRETFIKGISAWNLRTFASRVDNMARGMFKSTLQAMVKKGLIKTEENYIVQKEERGDELYFPSHDYSEMDGVNYDDAIRTAQQNAFDALELKNESDAYLRGKWQEWNKLYIKELSDKYKISDVRKQLRITAVVNEYEAPERFQNITIAMAIRELNILFIDGLKRQAANQHQKIISENPCGLRPTEKGYKKERGRSDYVDIQNFLTDYFMPITSDEALVLGKKIGGDTDTSVGYSYY